MFRIVAATAVCAAALPAAALAAHLSYFTANLTDLGDTAQSPTGWPA